MGHLAALLDDQTARIDGVVVSIPGVSLTEVLGDGANGVVFGGKQLLLERSVAVKVWPPRVDRRRSDTERVKQAIAEAKKLSVLKSDVIASIYSIALLDNGWPYAVMERIDGVTLSSVRESMNNDFSMRNIFWGDVHKGLDEAERSGVYHGDLHGGNVMVRPFRATVIDFGTSALAGRPHSLQRHAKLVYEFALWLLPELIEYVEPPNIPKLVKPEYATQSVASWVEAAGELRILDSELSDLSEDDLMLRVASLARGHSTTLIDLNAPVGKWLAERKVSGEVLEAYWTAAQKELEARWATRRRAESSAASN